MFDFSIKNWHTPPPLGKMSTNVPPPNLGGFNEERVEIRNNPSVNQSEDDNPDCDGLDQSPVKSLLTTAHDSLSPRTRTTLDLTEIVEEKQQREAFAPSVFDEQDQPNPSTAAEAQAMSDHAAVDPTETMEMQQQLLGWCFAARVWWCQSMWDPGDTSTDFSLELNDLLQQVWSQSEGFCTFDVILNPGELPMGEQWDLFLTAVAAAASNISSPDDFNFAIESIEVLAAALEPWLGPSVRFSALAPFSTAKIDWEMESNTGSITTSTTAASVGTHLSQPSSSSMDTSSLGMDMV